LLSDSLWVSVSVAESVSASPLELSVSPSLSVLVTLSESLSPQVNWLVPEGMKPSRPIESDPVACSVCPPEP
jgi:hypothetical protein